MYASPYKFIFAGILFGIFVILGLGLAFVYYNGGYSGENSAFRLTHLKKNTYRFGASRLRLDQQTADSKNWIAYGLKANLRRMESDGVIKSRLFAQLLAKLGGYEHAIKSGVYTFSNKESSLQILKALKAGQEAHITFTIPEGYDIFDIDTKLFSQKLIQEKGMFITYATSPKALKEIRRAINIGDSTALVSIEGFVYPDTYRLRLSRPHEDILALGLKNFQAKLLPIFQQNDVPASKWVSYLTIASLVEKETAKTDEKARIASVVFNRLKQRMKLRYDPTIIYALKVLGLYADSLTEQGQVNIQKRHFGLKSRFNTYYYRGLPLGPITSPTKSSLLAALHPEESQYLFFVAKKKGDQSLGHDFSLNYEDHLLKIEKYKR